jgi:regulator of chromosome condensation
VVESLKIHGRGTYITGGNHHSITVTDKGECLVWGRLGGYATRLELDQLPSENITRDLRDKPRVLKVPTRVPGLHTAFSTAGSGHCIAITTDHKAFSWGFNADGQTGQKTQDDVECATLIDYPAIRGKRLVWAGAGGQYSMLAGEDMPMANDDH